MEPIISLRFCVCLVRERGRVHLGFPHARIRGACFPSNWKVPFGIIHGLDQCVVVGENLHFFFVELNHDTCQDLLVSPAQIRSVGDKTNE
ncbi:unnamed protein product [Sphenostylis stenocarpa]|uniref:Uncharacterized protein n=1 Tax=Sphenostylis stenocarpa TaxID=92480 RepID=A0AA86S0Z7_9FABA|nr:unnamed protein product [Sphenostylis stenocarpa]